MITSSIGRLNKTCQTLKKFQLNAYSYNFEFAMMTMVFELDQDMIVMPNTLVSKSKLQKLKQTHTVAHTSVTMLTNTEKLVHTVVQTLTHIDTQKDITEIIILFV